MKNTDTPKEFCDRFDACPEGCEFALRYATMAEVWDNCPRPDWLMWIMEQLEIPQDAKKNRLFACWCAEFTPLADGRTTWDLLTDERSRNAVRVALRFARDEANQDELAAAWYAAGYAAWDAAGYAAGSAAGSAARYAAWAAARVAAWGAALDAAGPTAWYAAGYAAGSAARAAQANHFRTLFPNPFKEEQ